MPWQQETANIPPELHQAAKAQRRQRRLHQISSIKARLRRMPIKSKMLSEAASPKRASFRPRGGTRCRPQHSGNRRLHGIVRSEAESRNALRPSEAIHRRIDDAPTRTQRRIRTVPTRSHCPKPQEACKTGSATGTNRLRGTVKLLSTSP